MAFDRGETDPVLVRIQAKIAAWQAAAESYRAALALEQSAGGDQPGRPTPAPLELPVGAFRGMRIPEAIKLYLQSMRRKQTSKEIAAGLREGGIETTAKNFETTVAGALHRMKDREVLRFKDGWDLAEAHSTAMRNRLAQDNGKKKPKKAKAKGAPGKPKKAEPKASAPKGPSIDERIQVFLGSRPMDWFTPKQVAEALHETNMPTVSLAFARLVRYGKIAKQNDGRYAAVRK